MPDATWAASQRTCFAPSLLSRLIKKIPVVGHYIPGTLAAIIAVSAGVHLSGLEIALVQMGAEGGTFVERVQEQFPREGSWDAVKIALLSSEAWPSWPISTRS